MKTNLKFIVLLAALLSAALGGIAQEEEQPVPQQIPRWISDKGYWVVESNLKTPLNSIIAWERDHQPKQNEQWVARALREP